MHVNPLNYENIGSDIFALSKIIIFNKRQGDKERGKKIKGNAILSITKVKTGPLEGATTALLFVQEEDAALARQLKGHKRYINHLV